MDGAELIRVLVADDHPLERLGVMATLQRQPDMQVVAEVADGREAVRQALRTRPDVVLLDVRMPGQGGLEALVQITQWLPTTRCVLLAGSDKSDQVLWALGYGAAVVLLEGAGTAELLRAIRGAYHGGSTLDLVTTRQLLRAAQARQAVGRPGAQLTRREQAVVGLLTCGMSNRELAAALGVSERTVTTHVGHILGKLGVKNRVQAALFARAHGLGDGAAQRSASA